MSTDLLDDYIVRPGGSLTIASGASLVLEDGSTLDTSGGYETFSANGNMPATSTLALVDTTGGSVTVTLPALASVASGHTFTFWKSVAANSMVIDGNAAEQIEGAANITRTAQYSVVQIRKVGAVWMLVRADANPDGITGAQLADDAVDSEHIADGAVDPQHLAGGARTAAADSAVVLDAADAYGLVRISTTAGAGARTIARGTLPAGASVTVLMTARDTNDYTATVLGGTVTFDAVNERAVLLWDGTNLVHTSIVGATFA